MPDARTAEVGIVGGGPVGLALACLLRTAGVQVLVLEARLERSSHPRSIGIHPPALEVLARAGVADRLVEAGVKVVRAHAYGGGTRLGTVAFAGCPPPYPFVLALPQPRAEAILCARLRRLAPEALLMGARVDGVEAGPSGTRLTLEDGRRVDVGVAVGCDGRSSRVRRAIGVAFEGRELPGRYLMADVADRTALGADAAVYLTPGGVVESFPLPGGVRRWVAAVAGEVPADAGAAAALLQRWVLERVGEDAPAGTAGMVSAFGTQRYLAQRFARGRVALAGDAAHVMPPFGGQGMNVGWLDAAALTTALLAVRGGRDLRDLAYAAVASALHHYDAARRPAARRAIRRAQLNQWLGAPAPRWAPVRAALLRWGLANPTVAACLARRFTLRGLEAGAAAPAAQARRPAAARGALR